MNILDLFEGQEDSKLTLMDAMRDFLPIAVRHLQLTELPNIEFKRNLNDTQVPTFGSYVNEDRTIYVDIENRHPVDILRTLAHEMVHYKQDSQHELHNGSWHTGSPIEDEAHAEAGVIMRNFNKKFPQYLKLNPITFKELK